MIFIELFCTFLLIGAINFGGGYSMIALIQSEVVVRHAWMTGEEFTDLLAMSQMTPGPVGINVATYAGYQAVANAGYPVGLAVCGSVLASVAVVLVPVVLALVVGRWLMQHKSDRTVACILRALRLAVVGLVAAAALSLATADNFGQLGLNRQFIVSSVIFVGVFLLGLLRRTNPLLLIAAAGAIGLVAYSL